VRKNRLPGVRKVSLDMATRVRITNEVRKRYRKASKKEKGKILDEFCATTEYKRHYAARVLRAKPEKKSKSPPGGPKPYRARGRKPVYTNDVRKALVKVWAILDCPCGKRLVANIAEVVKILEKHGELDLTGEVRSKLLSVSASTADRLLAGERKKFELKCRSKTRPGSLLKHQIPIRTFADWDDARPGFLEMDLVGHDGGNLSGDFCQSLDATDVATGWTEIRAVKNKAQKWVFPAIEDIGEKLPFPLLGVDSDNGSEFINAELKRFCESHRITFTRSRPYRKNDSCFVEQKNFTAVRRNVGYLRYDTESELEILNELYSVLCPYLNFFIPQMKLVEKTRVGSKVKKRYDKPRTPYARVLENPDVDELTKKKLKRQYAKLNPAEMKRRILKLQDKLYKRAVFKKDAAVTDARIDLVAEVAE
jgi:hypothetical protein